MATCAMLLAFPASAADKSAATGKTTHAAKIKRMAWAPETLSGQIMSVEADKNLVIVEDASGVPFDLLATTKTRILSPTEQTLKLSDLASDTSRKVSVHFVPERKGDVAWSIDLSTRG